MGKFKNQLEEPYFETLRDEDGDMHIVPEEDCIVHRLNMKCHCLPFFEPKTRLEYNLGEAYFQIIIHRYLRSKENQH